MLTIQPNTYSSQSKNCWLYVQIGTVAFYFWRWWRRDNTDTAWRVEIGMPEKRAKWDDGGEPGIHDRDTTDSLG